MTLYLCSGCSVDTVMGIIFSMVKFSLFVFNSLLLWFSLSTSTKMSPSLIFFILKGSDPITATMALFTANGDSFDRGLSLCVPFTNRNRGHEQNPSSKS